MDKIISDIWDYIVSQGPILAEHVLLTVALVVLGLLLGWWGRGLFNKERFKTVNERCDTFKEQRDYANERLSKNTDELSTLEGRVRALETAPTQFPPVTAYNADLHPLLIKIAQMISANNATLAVSGAGANTIGPFISDAHGTVIRKSLTITE